MTALYLSVLLPTLVLGLHGSAFEAQLASTPHTVADLTLLARSPASSRYPDSLTLAMEHAGRELHIDLEKHETLYAPDYEHIEMAADGSVLARTPLGEEGHCVYQGKVYNPHDVERSNAVGHALLSVCDGAVEGRIKGLDYDFVVARHPTQSDRHAIFERDDYSPPGYDNWKCGESETKSVPLTKLSSRFTEVDARARDRESSAHQHPSAPQRRRRLQAPGGPNGLETKLVQMLIIHDKSRCDDFNNWAGRTTNAATIVAATDAIYAEGFTQNILDYKITFTVKASVSFAQGDPWPFPSSPRAYHTTVRTWVAQAMEDGTLPSHDTSFLFTSIDISTGYGGILGIASSVSYMCMAGAGGLMMTPSSWPVSFSAHVLAHEVGHLLGTCSPFHIVSIAAFFLLCLMPPPVHHPRRSSLSSAPFCVPLAPNCEGRDGAHERHDSRRVNTRALLHANQPGP